MILFLYVLNLILFLECTNNSTNQVHCSSNFFFSQPSASIILPDILHEISDIVSIDSVHIACIQDEKGILFIYSVNRNKITHQYKFNIDGDYEGIAQVGKNMYILRSDGVLSEIVNYADANVKVYIYETGMPCENNEGLCYDKQNNRLLISCKSKIEKGMELKDKRMIYAFDLKNKKLITSPVFSFDMIEIKKLAEGMKIKLPTKTNKKDNTIEAILKFRPSAIAIHPINKKLYLLSGIEHLLFIFDTSGKLLHIEQLDPIFFNQAEGITFMENGDAFISNEGQDKKPTLLKFEYQY